MWTVLSKIGEMTNCKKVQFDVVFTSNKYA